MTKFWLDNLPVLYKRNNLLEIIPFTNMNLNTKLNAIFRLSIYFSFIMFMIKKDYRYLLIIIIIGILTIIIARNYSRLNIENNPVDNIIVDSNSNDDYEGCKIPTPENPFMNPTFEDYENGNLKKACNSYDNTVIRELENEYFNQGLYRDQFDVFENSNSQREFYTMPVNSIINDTVKFAEWCYKTPPTCKGGNGIQFAADINAYTMGVRGGPGTPNS